MRSNKIFRPRFQVASKVNTTSAISNGNQPPDKIFGALAPKNAKSISRKKAMQASATSRRHLCNAHITVNARIVSIAIVPVTAMPYADARLLEV